MKAIARTLRIAPKKIGLIAGLVRNKNAVEALNILKFTPKKGAHLLYKIVHSAMANAENNFKQERGTLFIREIVVTEGAKLKRSVPVSRGRMNPILKRTSHVTVSLVVKDEASEKGPQKELAKVPEKKEGPKKITKKPVTRKKNITTVKA